MERFPSPAVALAYAVFAGMGVVALLVWTGLVAESLVRRVVFPPVLVVLALTGLWEWWRRRTAEADGDDA